MKRTLEVRIKSLPYKSNEATEFTYRRNKAMKIYLFLPLFGSLIQADFLDFWKESNLFAYQIRYSFARKRFGKLFWKHYEEIKNVLKFYQSDGLCESTITSPTYKAVTFDAVFDEKVSVGENVYAFAQKKSFYKLRFSN